jgi:hypothetical protein
MILSKLERLIEHFTSYFFVTLTSSIASYYISVDAKNGKYQFFCRF